MRKYIDIITEAVKPTKTKTKGPVFNVPPAPDGNKVVPGGNNNNVGQSLPGQTASAAKARTKTSTIGLSPDAVRAMTSLSTADIHDELSDREAARLSGRDTDTTDGAIEPVTPENLPAVISKDLTTNNADFNPEWTMVKHLPGYLQNPIRALGRQIFRQFTNIPIEDIQVLTSLTSPESDVRKMMAYISRRGIKDDETEMDFDQVMPGVKADVQLWRMLGYEFLLVKDMMGYYIYSWPGGRGVHLGKNSEPKQLK